MLEFHTYGCKVNTYDTGLLQKRLKSDALTGNSQKVHIVNTCAVTAEATKDAVRQVRRLKRKEPGCKVVVTGCAAQVDTESFQELSEADLVVANSHKGDLNQLIEKMLSGNLEQKVHKSNIFKKEDLEAGGGVEKGHTRSFLKIQDGCNSFCTFCVIPFARGKSRSLSADSLVERINELYGQGVREVVLTGVHIGDYEDEGKGLEDLVEYVLKNTEIQRFRLSSLEPIELSERLLDLYTDERMCSHFHMSIQSAQTKVLHDMKRKYTAEQVADSFERIAKKVPNAFVGMDVIAGFPGETEEEFQQTYDLLAATPWTRMHVFPYSPRPSTYANRLEGQLRREEILKRSARLRELSSERYAEKALAQIGEVKRAMILNSSANTLRGLSRDYWQLQIENISELNAGDEINVEVTGFDHSDKNRMDGVLTARRILDN